MIAVRRRRVERPPQQQQQQQQKKQKQQRKEEEEEEEMKKKKKERPESVLLFLWSLWAVARLLRWAAGASYSPSRSRSSLPSPPRSCFKQQQTTTSLSSFCRFPPFWPPPTSPISINSVGADDIIATRYRNSLIVDAAAPPFNPFNPLPRRANKVFASLL